MGKKRNGRKSQYDILIKPHLKEITQLVSEGYTEGSICKKFGVGKTAFCNYKNQFPELEAAVNEGRAQVESLVVNALLKIALGFMDDTGKYHAPNIKAIQMILNNYSDTWKNMGVDEAKFKERELKVKEDLAREKCFSDEGGIDE